jgi:diguanylate cyclase (GGDEF)-like protein
MLLRLLTDRSSPIDFALAGLLVVVGYAAILHRSAVQALEVGRRAEADGFARILSGLSRSVSPDAIVDAIVEELGNVTRADHIVVVRRRTDARMLEATLVSSRPGVPPSTTQLPLSDLVDPSTAVLTAIVRRRADNAVASDRREPVAIPIQVDDPLVPSLPADPPRGGHGPGILDTARGLAARAFGPTERDATIGDLAGVAVMARPPAPPATRTGPTGKGLGSVESGPMAPDAASAAAGQRAADRIAARVRSIYGLKDTLASALIVDSEPVGALVLSRRIADAWPSSTERLLGAAALEASAALSRAYSHRQAETLASTDGLTGLPNRRYFDEFCGLLARRRRADDAVGVLMVDIDRFKSLNDRFGHAVGDEVLRAVARAIASAVREADVPARYGGEEFAVLLRNPSRAIALEVGERVREAVHGLDLRPFGVPGVTVSIGVAVASASDQPIDDLVEQADRALYRSKRAGRDRVSAA